MINIYTASKLQHAETWRNFWVARLDVHWTARWIFNTVAIPEDDPRNVPAAKHYWIDNEQDVRAADVVIGYCAPGETLRGALVEIGIALALGKRVVLVGKEDEPCFGTWQFHPLVTVVTNYNISEERRLSAAIRVAQGAQGAGV